MIDLHTKYGIPEKPPDSFPMREELMWFMIRENYRINKEYEDNIRKGKYVGKMFLWIAGTIVAIASFWDWIKHLAK